ncbi:MAG: SDR family oxidoreductase [Chloroflexi bacterium]|nr:SDR family oxidoreductase [Chloroflexota bacterium]
MQNILITGANRGIGFELTRQLLKDDSQIFATCRAPESADALNELAREHADRVAVLPMDVNDKATIDGALEAVAGKVDALDLLINNAGIGGDERGRIMGQLTASEVSHVMATNAVAPLIVTQAFRDLLKRGNNPRVVMISSGLGSLQRTSGTSYAYRMSKAAMNMAARVLAFDSAMNGITTVTMNPGWVQTDMGGPSASLKPEESGDALRALINRLTPAENGMFFQYDGSELPW